MTFILVFVIAFVIFRF